MKQVEIENFDKIAKEYIFNFKNKSTNENSFKILDIVYKLFDVYSFTKNQTYPRPNHPDKEKQTDVYFTIIAILLSLRTTLENEQQAVNNFMKHFKSPYEVINTDITKLADIIKVAGMPNKKASIIIQATKYILENFNNDFNFLKNKDIPDIRKILMNIPGIGEKSADCILELGFDLPSIVIDVNMLRVISRLFNYEWAEKPDLSNKNQITEIKNFLENNLEKDGFLYQIIHTMLLLHGKHICKAQPKCNECIIRNMCLYFQK